jgi:hypothetical protein
MTTSDNEELSTQVAAGDGDVKERVAGWTKERVQEQISSAVSSDVEHTHYR